MEYELETPRQRYLRNHQENIRTMRAVLLRAEKEDPEYAEMIRPLVETWEKIGQKAQNDEDRGVVE